MNLQIEHHQVLSNGLAFHVVQAGPIEGPVAILLHGFPEFWQAWANQLPALVSAGFRVWIPDQRGYNTSDKPETVQSYRLDTLMRDICGMISATGKSQVVLCGHDWGGAVAWRLAQQYPDKVSRLVVVNSPHNAAMAQRLKSSLSQMRKSWYMLFFQIPWLAELALSRNNYQALVNALRKTSRPGSFSDAEINEYRAAWRQPGAMTGMLNWYRALFRTKIEMQGRQRIRVPTLLIWGAQDHAFDRELAGQSIEFCDNGRLELIEDAGHWILHEQAPRVSRLIQEFLAPEQ